MARTRAQNRQLVEDVRLRAPGLLASRPVSFDWLSNSPRSGTGSESSHEIVRDHGDQVRNFTSIYKATLNNNSRQRVSRFYGVKITFGAWVSLY